MIEQTPTQTRRERRMAAEAHARRTAKARAAKTGRKVGVVLGTSGLLLTTSVAAMADGDAQSEGRAQATLSVEPAGGTELVAHAAPAAVTASAEVELAFDRPAVSTEGPAEADTSSTATAEPATSEATEQSYSDGTQATEAAQPTEAPAAQTTEATQAASSTVEPEPAPAANSSVISAAYSAIGTPYLWAGSTRGGMDCSGFINWAYAQAGQPLPGGARSTHGMLASFARVSEPQPGDIVVATGIRSQYHAGIYVGNGQMIGSLAASGVTTHGYHDSWHNVVAILRPY
ncbi:C40 family peptidase [Nesterenkonia haasae]|uniref:C40 family peptidase n=1 Tax=Nesterenkonia haasae TaxID=2587813 RepID=UPI001F3CF410|nr:C40 family peptidase [Nesterenkonia haasae]